jgi:predicted  nucleic acid-binding Zn-ribbon protein
MQTESRLDRDTDLLQEYLEVLDRKAARPSPFGKVAAFAKLGLLRRRLQAAVLRQPDPELERAEAAAVAETGSTWGRRFSTSFWGNRALMAALLVGGQQIVLIAILILSAGYLNLFTRPVNPENGYLPAVTRNAVLFLIFFVFAFYFATPLFSLLLMWGGRFFRSWRVTAPALLLLVLVASAATYMTFRNLSNPLNAPDSLHSFIITRSGSAPSDINPYKAYYTWLDMNWLLKDPKFRADYEEYLRRGPGRWLTNRFDTTKSEAWADPQTLVYIGEFVDQYHDQAKFREWLRDYVERNKIYSRDIDKDIDVLVGPANQRFLSVWQAEPFLRERDAHVHRNYYEEVYRRVRQWGVIYFVALVVVYLALYLLGPAFLVTGWVARSLKLQGAANAVDRAKSRYYGFPEQRDLGAEPLYAGAYDLLSRIHRSYVRAVLAVTAIVFVAWAVWLASRVDAPRPMTTQSSLMSRFVAFPSTDRPVVATGVDPAAAPAVNALPQVADAAAPQFVGGMGDPAVAVDRDGDGVPDEAPLPLEARLAAIQRQIDDSDWEFRKKFKATEALLTAYKREIETLRKRNAQLESRTSDIASQTSALGGRVASAESSARSAASSAEAARGRAEALSGEISSLAGSVQQRTDALDRRAAALEQRDDELQTQSEAIATDLDERTRELTARTERLGDRTTDLAERAEQIAGLQQTVYTALVDELRRQIGAIERRSHSRLYRMFNKKEALAQLADLRRRIQLVRAELREAGDPDSLEVDAELEQLQREIGPVESRYK